MRKWLIVLVAVVLATAVAACGQGLRIDVGPGATLPGVSLPAGLTVEADAAAPKPSGSCSTPEVQALLRALPMLACKSPASTPPTEDPEKPATK